MAALVIACGLHVANISESHAGVTQTQLLDRRAYYRPATGRPATTSPAPAANGERFNVERNLNPGSAP
jgi:hypothetical protein